MDGSFVLTLNANKEIEIYTLLVGGQAITEGENELGYLFGWEKRVSGRKPHILSIGCLNQVRERRRHQITPLQIVDSRCDWSKRSFCVVVALCDVCISSADGDYLPSDFREIWWRFAPFSSQSFCKVLVRYFFTA